MSKAAASGARARDAWRNARKRGVEAAETLARAVERSRAFAFFCALLAADIAYRLVLIFHLSTDPVTPFSFMPVLHDLTAIVRCFAFDFAFVAGLSLALGVAGAIAFWLTPLRLRVAFARAGSVLLGLLAAAIGLDTGIHLRTLLAMHAGFDAAMLNEALSNAYGRELLRYAQLIDLVLAVLPLALFVWFMRMPARRLRVRLWSALSVSLACLLAYLPYLANPYLHRPQGQLNAALRWAPAYYLSYFVYHELADGPGEYERLAERLPSIEHHGLFLNGSPSDAPAPPRSDGTRYNIVLIIMESVGASYAFDTHEGNPVPMPRLHELMAGGLELRRHYASSNTSPRAIFSLYTGLYPQPTPAMFVTRPDIYIPGIASFLGNGYERFFVTPGRLKFYLPRAMFEHDGLRELYGYDELPIRNPLPMPGFIGRNEIQTVDFFLERLRSAKEPFFSVYYSFAPHYDYYDHGPEFRIFENLDVPKNRYYNNLRLLDTQIGRIVDQLEKQGRLEHTVLVIVGDHGEGFGQHRGDVTHSRHSFEENFRTPALFWQPKLFPASHLDAPSSHVDILPTLLEALGIPFDREQMQGVSLLGGAPSREYLYLYGNENTVSSLERGERKLQISFPRDRCWYFDLAHDRLEHSKRPCGAAEDAQRDNLLEFWEFERRALARYNDDLIQKLDARSQAQP